MRLQSLPFDVRLHLETHLENLALLAEATSPERLSGMLERDEEGFLTSFRGVQVHFVVNAVARTMLVYRIDAPPAHAWEPTVESPEGG